MIELILVILGLAGLVLGSHLTINGALNIAEHFKLGQIFIGLTILAIGTDLPELFVDITGAIHRLQGTETSGLIIGETIGTCFGQIALTLGIVGLFAVLTLTKKELVRDGSMMLGSILLLLLLSLDGKLSRFDGAVLIVVYLIYFGMLFREEKIFGKIKRAPSFKLGWSIISLLSGFAILIYSSNIAITNAVSLAEIWGVKQSLIGILLLGLGTSLPELFLALTSLYKKATPLAIGNLVGSNIFDILFTVGAGSVISEFIVNKNILLFDIPFLFFTSVIALYFLRTKMRIHRHEAVVLILIYIAYIGFKLWGM